ncbi:hypothetical protein WJX84_011331 [Apatococcus fuscideae]|uniref:F-box domain-containing protein n=1 Tax=Apatococcus fuscideae TaxID=2026836 RepID=A0AAW1STW7_9CHLO
MNASRAQDPEPDLVHVLSQCVLPALDLRQLATLKTLNRTAADATALRKGAPRVPLRCIISEVPHVSDEAKLAPCGTVLVDCTSGWIGPLALLKCATTLEWS